VKRLTSDSAIFCNNFRGFEAVTPLPNYGLATREITNNYYFHVFNCYRCSHPVPRSVNLCDNEEDLLSQGVSETNLENGSASDGNRDSSEESDIFSTVKVDDQLSRSKTSSDTNIASPESDGNNKERCSIKQPLGYTR